jgi:hypothetical protein
MDKDDGHPIFSPKNIRRNDPARNTEFKMIEDIPSTSMRKAASRKFSFGWHLDIRKAWLVCCWHFGFKPGSI